MVIVNTVVYVQAYLGLGERQTAWALAAFGSGSMLAALTLPRLLERIPDRVAMLTGAGLLITGLVLGLAMPTFAGSLPTTASRGIRCARTSR